MKKCNFSLWYFSAHRNDSVQNFMHIILTLLHSKFYFLNLQCFFIYYLKHKKKSNLYEVAVILVFFFSIKREPLKQMLPKSLFIQHSFIQCWMEGMRFQSQRCHIGTLKSVILNFVKKHWTSVTWPFQEV